MSLTVAQIAALAAATVPPADMSTRVVAVDGLGGAGKTTLSRRLARALGDAPIVKTDDFASWDNPLDWWPRLLEQVLEPLSVNQPARYQRYDWDERRLAEWHDVAPGGLLVLEGVSASRVAFRPYLSYRIWVETPEDERLRRGLARDGEATTELWRDWMSAEYRYVQREHPGEAADLVVSGTEELPD
jgi:uridine kinase